MDALSGLVAIGAALVPFIIWLWKRHDANIDDPGNEQKKRYETIDSDIAKGNSLVATQHASDDLDELDRLRIAKGN